MIDLAFEEEAVADSEETEERAKLESWRVLQKKGEKSRIKKVTA